MILPPAFLKMRLRNTSFSSLGLKTSNENREESFIYQWKPSIGVS
jgi:hypothetical protein